ALRALSAWRRMDLDVAIERRLRILESEVAFATTEQREEDLAEVFSHLGEGGQEQLARCAIDLADGLLQRLPRFGEISALRGEEIESLRGLLVLLDRQHVHRSKRLELLTKGVRLRA